MITPEQARDQRASKFQEEQAAVLENAERYIDPFLRRGEYQVHIPRELRPYVDEIAARYREQGWQVKRNGTALDFAEPPAEGNDR